MVKKVVIGMLILILLGLYIGNKMWNKPHLDISNTKATLIIGAEDLLKSFKEDEAAAGLKYINKIISVQGRISSIKNENNQLVIQLETSDPMSNVICNMDISLNNTMSGYKESDAVEIKGVCAGYLTDVILDRCVISK